MVAWCQWVTFARVLRALWCRSAGLRVGRVASCGLASAAAAVPLGAHCVVWSAGGGCPGVVFVFNAFSLCGAFCGLWRLHWRSVGLASYALALRTASRCRFSVVIPSGVRSSAAFRGVLRIVSAVSAVFLRGVLGCIVGGDGLPNRAIYKSV